MLAALALAATPCADPAFCPTRQQFVEAVSSYDDSRLWELNAADPDDAHPIALVMLQRVVRVTDLYCGDREGESAAVTCKAVFHYPKGRSHRTLRLVKGAGGWKVEAAMSVFQPR